MKLLGIDTTGKKASVALLDKNKVLRQVETGESYSHLKHLMPMIKQVLDSCCLSLKDIHGIAVSQGPGSFTGIRIGYTTAKTLAQINQLEFISVPTLEGLAYNLEKTEGIICPLVDGRRNQVYASAYIFRLEKLFPVLAPRIYLIEEFAYELKKSLSKMGLEEKSVNLIGDGALIHQDALSTRIKKPVFHSGAYNEQQGASIGRLGYEMAKLNRGLDIYRARPDYMKLPEAERKLDKVSIKAMEESDIEAVLKVEADSFKKQWTRDMFLNELSLENTTYYVAITKTGEVAGYIGYWKVLDEYHVTNIAVHSNFRRKGFAEKLINVMIAKGKEEGVKAITLEVGVSNFGAIALYEKFEFKKSGIRKNYYPEVPEDGLVMWKQIEQKRGGKHV